jgi:hypothetical protein
VDGILSGLESVAKIQCKTASELLEIQKEKIKSGAFQYQTIKDNKNESKKLQNILTLRDCVFSFNSVRFIYNWTCPLRLVTGPSKYIWTQMPIDLGGILELLCEVEGMLKQVYHSAGHFTIFYRVYILLLCL